jgi:Bacterial PH domain
MTIDNHGHEHEFEPQFGLPERLPANERIVWQASPDVGVLARDAFHIRKLAFYFALLMVARAAPEVMAGASFVQVLLSLKWLAPIAALGLGIAWTLAWLTARTTVYTLTNKRMVMRLGIVLTVTFNLPLAKIASAGLRRHHGDFGDITLALSGTDQIAWVHLWPSVRPWKLAKAEPMVRCVANADALAAQLSDVWSAATGLSAAAPVARADTGAAPASTHHLQASPT